MTVQKDRKESKILLGGAFLFLLVPFVYRCFFSYICIKPHFDEPLIVFWTIFKHDSIILSFLAVFYVISSLNKGRLLKITCRFFICLTLFFYCLDLIIFKVFTTRLSFNDFIKYSGDIGFLQNFASPLFILLIILCSIILVTVSFEFFTHKGPQSKGGVLSVTAIAIIIAGVHFYGQDDKSFIHNWIFYNFIENNAGRGLDVPYSEKYKLEILTSGINDGKKCGQKVTVSSKKNIILLILESFSMYHSKYFSGINDYTPHLDKIAAEGRAFVNFTSNGYSTEHALISFFTGQPPIPNLKKSQYNFCSDNFNGYYDLKKTLPKILIENGYHTEFLTSGNLAFSQKGEWLDNLGFDYIEGHDAFFYNNYKRFHFSAAPDEALYKRSLDRIKKDIQKSPYFIAIETVSTHLPFIDPVSEKRSETLAVQYADSALGKFYSGLKNINFFESGILVIVSDHRSMTLITEKENKKFGEKATALVPMVICSKGFSGVETEQFQQTDIFNSITNYVTGNICRTKFDGDFFVSPSISPRYTVYVRGDNRSLIDVFMKNKYGSILLNGDHTKLIVGKIDDEEMVINRISYDRIKTFLSLYVNIDARVTSNK